eukprot:15348944-Ditylum_brightwellii.AAC.1
MSVFPPECVQEINGKFYLLGVVGESVKQAGNLYKANWNYTGLNAMNIAGTFLLLAVLLAAEVKNKQSRSVGTNTVESLLNSTDACDNGEPLGSGCEMEEDEFGKEILEEKNMMQ